MPFLEDTGGFVEVPGGNNAAIHNIANAIASLIQPYKRQEIGLRAAISKDPALAQKLTDLAATNPDAMTAIAGPNAAKYFAGLDSSPETKARIATRPEVSKQLEDPDTRNYVASQSITGLPSGTPGAIQQDKLKGDMAEAGFEVNQNGEIRYVGGVRTVTKMAPGQVATDQQQVRRMHELEAALDVPDLRNEWVKLVTGQPSKLNWRQVSAIAADPAHKDLILPWIEEQRNERAKELINSRWALGDKSYKESLDKYVLQTALKLRSGTDKNVMIGDFVKMLGGSEEMITQYGGSTPEGLVEAQKTFDANSDLKSKSLGASAIVAKNIAIIDKIKDVGAKQVILQTINDAALQMQVPVQYTLDKKGRLIQLGADVTPTQAVPTRNQGNTVVPNTVPKSGGGSSGSSTTARGSTTSSAPVYSPPKHIVDMGNAVATMTIDELKKSPTYQSLDKDAQAYLLSKAKK